MRNIFPLFIIGSAAILLTVGTTSIQAEPVPGPPFQEDNPSSRQISITAGQLNQDNLLSLNRPDIWFYRSGDDPSWRQPDLSADEWQPVSPGMTGEHLPADWNGNGWFAVVLQVDSTLFGREIGISGRIYGAMELYLNGRPIGSRGTVGTTGETEESTGYFEPVYLTLDDRPEQVLAVRYSNHNYRKAWGENIPVGLVLNVGNPEHTATAYSAMVEAFGWQTRILPYLIGFMLALALLHFILYLYYPSRKSNLIYSGLLISYTVYALSNQLLGTEYRPDIFVRYLQGEGFAIISFAVLNLYFAFRIIGKSVDRWLMGFTVAGILLLTYNFYEPFQARTACGLLLFLSLLWVIALYLHRYFSRGQKSLNIILAAFCLYFILILPRALYVFFGSELFLWAESITVTYLSGLVLPLGYSIYLARSIAGTNQKLTEELALNRELAAENLKREQEKKRLIEKQKIQLEKEVENRTAELKQSLEGLKEAQSQLVQQEKLASLGQLTAGIAHEIKNPLNFVNNFAEVSGELIQEAREEVENYTPVSGESATPAPDKEGASPANPGNGQAKAVIFQLLDDIQQNVRKISEHGRRADSIVRSMLMHSRGKSGERQPTDINRLLYEYTDLTYHGMRARDQQFNIDIQKNFDDTIGEIEVVPQDISRALLNIIGNGMEAASARAGSETKEYNPTIRVSTRKTDQGVEIEIFDNGGGIPEEARSHIFEPFFTTKVAGEGTGLGLSMSHEIIVDQHGGTIEVDVRGGESTLFRIVLPQTGDKQKG